MPGKSNCSTPCPACGTLLHFGNAFGGVSIFSCPGCDRRWEQRSDDLFYREGSVGEPSWPPGNPRKPLRAIMKLYRGEWRLVQWMTKDPPEILLVDLSAAEERVAGFLQKDQEDQDHHDSPLLGKGEGNA